MVQCPDEMSETQEPPPAPGGLTNVASFNMSSTLRRSITVDNNSLCYSSPNHSQANQTIDVSSAAATPIDPILLQQFGNRIENGHHSNQVISTGYSQCAGMADNANSPFSFLQPGWADTQALHHEIGGSMGYDDVYNMNHMGPGGFGHSRISTLPAAANTDFQEQQGQTDNSGANRWTPKMDKRLLFLKNDGKPHKIIAKTLTTEFPSAKGLNDNMVAKRLKSLRENAADATKVDKCVNRCLPKMLPVLANAVAQVAQEHGYEHVENEQEDIELELRAELKKIIQKRMLDRQRPRATAVAAAASRTQTRVVKSTGWRTRAPHINSSNSQSGNASGSTDPSAPTNFGFVSDRH